MSLDFTFVDAKKPYVKPRVIPREELNQTLSHEAFAGWTFQTWHDGKKQIEALEKEFKFESFPQTIEFMASLVDFCEDIQHHPAWANDYKRLRVSLTTWAVGAKISAYDLGLAEEFNRRFTKISAV